MGILVGDGDDWDILAEVPSVLPPTIPVILFLNRNFLEEVRFGGEEYGDVCFFFLVSDARLTSGLLVLVLAGDVLLAPPALWNAGEDGGVHLPVFIGVRFAMFVFTIANLFTVVPLVLRVLNLG